MGVFVKIRGSDDFLDLWKYFPEEKVIEYVYRIVDRVHGDRLTGLWIPH
jgi:hypothetical protein